MIQFKNQRYFRAQFTQKFPPEHGINQFQTSANLPLKKCTAHDRFLWCFFFSHFSVWCGSNWKNRWRWRVRSSNWFWLDERFRDTIARHVSWKVVPYRQQNMLAPHKPLKIPHFYGSVIHGNNMFYGPCISWAPKGGVYAPEKLICCYTPEVFRKSKLAWLPLLLSLHF